MHARLVFLFLLIYIYISLFLFMFLLSSPSSNVLFISRPDLSHVNQLCTVPLCAPELREGSTFLIP